MFLENILYIAVYKIKHRKPVNRHKRHVIKVPPLLGSKYPAQVSNKCSIVQNLELLYYSEAGKTNNSVE